MEDGEPFFIRWKTMDQTDNVNNVNNDVISNGTSDAATSESPKPFTFLQPFGEENVGVCDVERNCS